MVHQINTGKKALPKAPFILKRLYNKYKRQKFIMVSWRWWLSLKLHNMSTGKVKVGFGPIKSGEHTLSNRKWHIDPIVDYINQHSDKYACDIFFEGGDLSRFDIVVQMKNFDSMDKESVDRLKKCNTILIYDITDNPLGCRKSYLEEMWYIESMDAVIISNPVQGEDICDRNSNVRLIGLPVINHKYKKDYAQREPVVILWEGYVQNLEFMDRLNAIVKRIARETNRKINMVYHSNIPSRDEGMIKYVKWSLRNWEKMFLNSDIATAIKPTDNESQRRKPFTKVNTYRAAGLPLICTPSEADKIVIEHGKTGYFAYTDEDWYDYLKELVEDAALREKVGTAGRKYVLENFSIEKIGQKYIALFNELIVGQIFPKPHVRGRGEKICNSSEKKIRGEKNVRFN